MLNIETYEIRFSILEGNDNKVLYLLDHSKYLDAPEKPLVCITPPGYTGRIEIPYSPNSIITINSDHLQLTDSCEYEELADLPDGVYHITLKVCPYDELFCSKYYLRVNKLESEYEKFLLTYNEIDDKVLKTLIEIEILIKSAKVSAAYGDPKSATSKYDAAMKKINRLTKVNCN
jgi:hypothetical protein